MTYPQPPINIFDAIKNYEISKIKEYIKSNYDINIKDHSGDTPLHAAVRAEYPEIVKLLLTSSNIDINNFNSYNNTPLHFTAKFTDNSIILELLIKAGANLNLQNKEGDTPIHTIAFFGHYPMVQKILEAGADFSIKNDKRQTPLVIAINNNYSDIIHLLQTYQEYNDLKLSFPKCNISSPKQKI